jgi:hypothetical protein
VLTPSTRRSRWLRLVVVRKEVWKTTWAFRVVSIGLVCVLAYGTRPVWTRAVGESLVCSEPHDVSRVDAAVIDDLDRDYLVFERARVLRQAGVTSRVLVPVEVLANGTPSPVSATIVQDLARLARVGDVETVPVDASEPISLNVALHVRQFLTDKGIRSVAVVTPRFRSERSMLIYRPVLEAVGVASYCVPVAGMRSPDTWAQSWHGVQDVALQFVKLQYYRFYILPFRFRDTVVHL